MKDAVRNEKKVLRLQKPIKKGRSARADQIFGPSSFIYLQLLTGWDMSEYTVNLCNWIVE